MKVKICGLTRADQARHAAGAGAAYLGFVFFPASPRALTPETAASLLAGAEWSATNVALVVDPGDELLDQLAALPIDMLQLHGSESPERVAEIKARSGLPAMKAIGIRDAADLPAIRRYAGVADQLLIDAKPPKGATRPGGNALAFDWSLIRDIDWPLPWLLAGGLTPGNAAEAIRQTGASQLDVSTGVERAKGDKDPALVEAFIEAASRSRTAA